jgi:hypothetical protein
MRPATSTAPPAPRHAGHPRARVAPLLEQVFRRLSALATRVLAYYTKRAPCTLPPPAAAPSPSPAAALVVKQEAAGASAAPSRSQGCPLGCGGAALEDLLLWLLSYRDLFSKRCAGTGRLTAWDPSVQFPVPPIFRPYK